MNIQELQKALVRLRLSGMSNTLETRLLEAQTDRRAPIDLIISLVHDEQQRRSDRLIGRRVARARFRDDDKTLDAFDFAFNKKMEKKLVFELAAGRFIQQREDVLLLGPPGTGKSQTITNLIADYVARGQRVLFDPWLTTNPSCPEELKKPPKVDVILVSHGHFDHIEDLLLCARDSGAAVVGIFEGIIAKFTALAVLLPIVAGQSGNTGAQALAVTMRGLALREIRPRHWLRVTFKEANVAVVNGIAVALTTSLGVYVWSRSLGLAMVIGISMVVSMVAAGLSGALIPMILLALGQDPAQSSSIILTTVTDVVGFFSFLGLATLLASMLPT